MPRSVCGKQKTHKHDCTSKETQTWCLGSKQAFTGNLETPYYRHQITLMQVYSILQLHIQESNLQEISHTSQVSLSAVIMNDSER